MFENLSVFENLELALADSRGTWRTLFATLGTAQRERIAATLQRIGLIDTGYTKHPELDEIFDFDKQANFIEDGPALDIYDRVDVFFPPNAQIRVKMRDKVKVGLTVIAEIP